MNVSKQGVLLAYTSDPGKGAGEGWLQPKWLPQPVCATSHILPHPAHVWTLLAPESAPTPADQAEASASVQVGHTCDMSPTVCSAQLTAAPAAIWDKATWSALAA